MAFLDKSSDGFAFMIFNYHPYINLICVSEDSAIKVYFELITNWWDPACPVLLPIARTLWDLLVVLKKKKTPQAVQ